MDSVMSARHVSRAYVMSDDTGVSLEYKSDGCTAVLQISLEILQEIETGLREVPQCRRIYPGSEY